MTVVEYSLATRVKFFNERQMSALIRPDPVMASEFKEYAISQISEQLKTIKNLDHLELTPQECIDQTDAKKRPLY